MSTNIVERNPCPKCDQRPHLMAGVLVKNEDKSLKHLVCWPCRMIRTVKKGEDWRKMQRGS